MHRHSVDAVAVPGRRRPIRKHVAEMTTAAAAVDFRSHHEVAAIGGCFDRAFERREEAGPAGAALELAIGHEQRLAACGAGEHAAALFVEQRTGPWPLGAVLP